MLRFLCGGRPSQHQKKRQSRNAPRHCRLLPPEFRLQKVLPRASPVKAGETIRIFSTVTESGRISGSASKMRRSRFARTTYSSFSALTHQSHERTARFGLTGDKVERRLCRRISGARAYEILTCRNPRAAYAALWGFVLRDGSAGVGQCRSSSAGGTRRASFGQASVIRHSALDGARLSGRAFIDAAHMRLPWPDRA